MLDHSAFQHITTFVFDVDGVLTDGSVLVTESGEFLRKMNVHDGQGIKIALKKGYKMAIITKGNSIGVRKRLEILGIDDIYDGLTEKRPSLINFIQKNKLSAKEILYVGDDLPDLDLLDLVGIFCCPRDAMSDVINKAHFIAHHRGGHGCVREIIERILRVQEKWYGD